ncbi:DUF805 domain-containing protein [Thiomicrorhabdus sp. zzn3]|uniref:DUF805 domain-containing protein n=1 Tax=Thiomicrorhabdus sp. zzn3 TaxID=3039775 RepID=UPI002436AA51|nr:DUF805 domain-containing protein [Thiomicrorhabdus sp. zzn3]MDG6779010.1 DUF805 domain-containing protein [Thiomicrorhabdus sp. zzn3]
MNEFLNAIKQYADFSGRATRKQYWLFLLFYLIFYFVLTVIDMSFNVYDEVYGIGLLTTIYSLGLFIPSLAVLARRLHDIGRTGWWMLIGLIPLIGPIVLIIFAVLDSQPGENQYGMSSKYPTTTPKPTDSGAAPDSPEMIR